MKKRRGLECAVALLLAVSGCGKKVPDEVIQPAAMENLLYDYHLASTMTNSLPYKDNYKKQAYRDYVFRKHHVTEAEFDSSMVWYTRHGSELATIYQNLQKRFSAETERMKKQVAKQGNQIDISMSGDTVNVWQDRTLYWLTSSDLTGKVTFDLKADTSFRPKDHMELVADFSFFPKQPSAGGKVVMGINYYFDNDSVQGLTRMVTASGRQRLYLRPDSAFEIRSISGFISYIPDESALQKGSVLVNDIRLLRYHDLNSSSVDTLQVGSKQSSGRARPAMQKMENRQ